MFSRALSSRRKLATSSICDGVRTIGPKVLPPSELVKFAVV
jgi:hypothetical protein